MSTRVLVVDDSALMRRRLTEILSQAGMDVVATAASGEEALARVKALGPDVVTMDLIMPGMGGLRAIHEIMRTHPLPIVVVSDLTRPQAEPTVEALLAGAVSCVAKPSGQISLDIARAAEEIVRQVRLAAQANVKRLGVATLGDRPPKRPPQRWTATLAVAASTGGPGALREFLRSLPFVAGLAVLVVQHMPPGFTQALAESLDRISAYAVREAQDGSQLAGGVAWVAPAGSQLTVNRTGHLYVDWQAPPVNGVKPSADVTFASLASVPGDKAVVVLTGMGRDGLKGAQVLWRQGALVLAQDAGSCVVDGMPRAVREAGLAAAVGPPGDLASKVGQWATHACQGGEEEQVCPHTTFGLAK
jgi:two-component system chemotaxis response regulator CheB